MCPEAPIAMGVLWLLLNCRTLVLCNIPRVPVLPAHLLELAAKGSQDVQKDDRQPSLLSAMAGRLFSECVLEKQDIMSIIPAVDKANIPTPV